MTGTQLLPDSCSRAPGALVVQFSRNIFAATVDVMDMQPTEPPRLLDQVRAELRRRRYSRRTERAYCAWVERFIVFHDRRHPRDLGEQEVEAFLRHLADVRASSASTLNQALAALLFLYRKVLQVDHPWMKTAIRAKRPEQLPVVLSRAEAAALLAAMTGVTQLMASLMYGAGLRLLECARLRIKDLDFERRQLVVRRGKGAKDRVTLLPDSLVPALAAHLEKVRTLHDRDLRSGAGFVELPDAYELKHPSAARDWPWQWVFPATRTYLAPNGQRRRHHLHESVLQRAFNLPCA